MPNAARRANRSRFGIDYPYIFPERKEIFDKIPTIDIANFQTIDGGPYPASSSGPIYTLSNNPPRSSATTPSSSAAGRAGRPERLRPDQRLRRPRRHQQPERPVRLHRRQARLVPAWPSAMRRSAVQHLRRDRPPRYTPYRGHMVEFFAQDSWNAPEAPPGDGRPLHLMQPYYLRSGATWSVFDPSLRSGQRRRAGPGSGNISAATASTVSRIPGTASPRAHRPYCRRRFRRVRPPLQRRRQDLGQHPAMEQLPTPLRPSLPAGRQDGVRDRRRPVHGAPRRRDNIFLGGNPPFQPMVSIADRLGGQPGPGEAIGFPQFFMTPTRSSRSLRLELERHRPARDRLQHDARGRLRRPHGSAPGARPRHQPTPVGNDPGQRRHQRQRLRPYKGFATIDARTRMPPARSTTGCSSSSTGASARAWASASLIRTRQARTMPPAAATRSTTTTMTRNFWGWSDFDTRHVPSSTPSGRRRSSSIHERRGSERPRWLADFGGEAVPDRHAVHGPAGATPSRYRVG